MSEETRDATTQETKRDQVEQIVYESGPVTITLSNGKKITVTELSYNQIHLAADMMMWVMTHMPKSTVVPVQVVDDEGNPVMDAVTGKPKLEMKLQGPSDLEVGQAFVGDFATIQAKALKFMSACTATSQDEIGRLKMVDIKLLFAACVEHGFHLDDINGFFLSLGKARNRS